MLEDTDIDGLGKIIDKRTLYLAVATEVEANLIIERTSLLLVHKRQQINGFAIISWIQYVRVRRMVLGSFAKG